MIEENVDEQKQSPVDENKTDEVEEEKESEIVKENPEPEKPDVRQGNETKEEEEEKEIESGLDDEKMITKQDDQSLIESIPTGNHLIKRSQSSPPRIKVPEIDYEPLYTSMLEWLLNKSPASIEGTVMIDDTDKIKSINIVFIILRLFRQAPESVKQKVIKNFLNKISHKKIP